MGKSMAYEPVISISMEKDRAWKETGNETELGVGRMRKPRVIWLGPRRSQRRPKTPYRVAGKPSPKDRSPGGSHHQARPMLWLYLATLAVAATILWATPERFSGVLPVSARAYRGLKFSWLSRDLAKSRLRLNTAEKWIREGIPYLALKAKRSPIHWSQLLGAGIADLAGTPLDSLHRLMAMELPNLQAVPQGRLSQPKPRIPPRANSRPLTAKGLPGDGHQVWAVLGQNPRVGIYQTFSMQSFATMPAQGNRAAYSHNWSKTIVNVGWQLADALHRQGVSVVQSRVNNMADGFLASYYTAYHTAESLLRQFPSVGVLLDVQRSALGASQTTTHVDGLPAARITLVVGSGQILPDPHWKKNEAFAKRLSQALTAQYPRLLSNPGIEVVPYRDNQQLLANDLIVEIGGPANTMAEEVRSAKALARALTTILPSSP